MAANVMEIYGSKVFNEHVMKERLPSATYKSLEKTLHKGAPLDIEVANVVASVMKPLPLGEVALRSNDGEGKPGMTDPPHSDNQTPFVRAALSQRPCFPVRILALSGAHAPALPRGESLQ